MRKGLEAWITLWIELLWTKQRILEVYLNIAQWGPGVFGAEAASRRYFRKPASALSKREAALLAASLPNPFARNPAKPSRRLNLIADAVQRRLPWIAKRAGCVSKP